MQRKGWSPPKMHSQITPQWTPTTVTVQVVSATLGLSGAVVLLWLWTYLMPRSLGTRLSWASAVLLLCPAVDLLPCQLLSPPQPGCCYVRIVFHQKEKCRAFLLEMLLMPQEGARANFLPVQDPKIPGKAWPRITRLEGGKGITLPWNFCHGMKYFGWKAQPPS